MKSLGHWFIFGMVVSAVVGAGAWVTRGSSARAAMVFGDAASAHSIPPQQHYSAASDPDPLPTFFEMSDLRLNPLIVRDVSTTPEGAGWRWTHVRPTLSFPLSNGLPRNFAMDFTIIDTVFKTTGPVTLTVSMNGHLLGTMVCDHAGDFQFEKTVPAEWLAGADYAVVEAALDKLWTMPTDGTKLGYILTREGFRN